MTYTITTLPNGLRMASEADASAHTAAFAIAVDVGARHEALEQGGLSHMLEHMAFKGTARMSAKQIAETFDMMGGNVNAYTSHEHTVYYARVLKEYAGDAARLLCEIVADSVFDPAELEREREVILQEIAMHHDSPDDLVFDLFQRQAFGDSPLGRSILGDPARIATFSRDDLVAFTATHYEPRRMVLAAAGAVDHAATLAIAQEFLGARKNNEIEKLPVTAAYKGGEETLEKDLEQVHLVIGFNGVTSLSDDYFASQVFATILGGGMSSRLFQEIREARGLAYSVSAFAAGYNDVGIIGMYSGTTVEHLPELTVALREVVESMRAGVSDAELTRAKNQIKANVLMGLESTATVVERIATHLLVYGRYRTAEEILPLIDAITHADMIRMAELVLSTKTPVIAALGPQGSVRTAGLSERLVA